MSAAKAKKSEKGQFRFEVSLHPALKHDCFFVLFKAKIHVYLFIENNVFLQK